MPDSDRAGFPHDNRLTPPRAPSEINNLVSIAEKARMSTGAVVWLAAHPVRLTLNFPPSLDFEEDMKAICKLWTLLGLVAVTMASTASAAEPVVVDLTTSEGVIRLELDAEKAPKTVANFVSYVNSGHYDGTIFHRVIPSFMIQGGGMTADMKEKKTEPPVVNESSNGLRNVKYTVAMARTSAPNSATSQFFINVANNDFLDRANAQDGYGYAVFGKVVSGQEVVDKIAAKKTSTKRDPASGIPMGDVPVEPITITSAKVVAAE